jgi:putative transposase
MNRACLLAASPREGMAETLTVLRLNMPPTLARTFRSTNAIESGQVLRVL